MSHEQQRKKVSRLLSQYTDPKAVRSHALVEGAESRREGLRSAAAGAGAGGCRWTEDMTALALDECECDEYLGLKFYRTDPLPFIRKACRIVNGSKGSFNCSDKDGRPNGGGRGGDSDNHNDGSRLMFVDHEFPVYESARLQVDLHSNKKDGEYKTVECTPGIISSSNIRDFRTDRNRVRRIPHFVAKAKLQNDNRSGVGDSSKKSSEWKWVRASSMEKNCTIFSSSPPVSSVDVRNVIQGKVGNCGFCSGFASIAASHPEVFVAAFNGGSASRNGAGNEEGNDCGTMECNRIFEECGAVSLLLYPMGQPRYLLLDDYVLCGEHGRDAHRKGATHRNGSTSTSSPSIHSLLPTDLWVRLIEKAYIKLQGSLASLDGHYKYNSLYRHPARALQLFTGSPVALEVHYSFSEGDDDVLYKLLAMATQGSYARVAHCRKTTEGLRSNHGYSLLWVGEGKSGVRLVCLRNPHGTGSFVGQYGFGRPTSELREALLGKEGGGAMPNCFETSPRSGRVMWKQSQQQEQSQTERGSHPTLEGRGDGTDNGIFFMEFHKFVECFPMVTLVGPIRPMELAAVASSNVNASLRSASKSNVPDCVHVVKRENLRHAISIVEEAASG
mmetsp:Transcript_39000/g.81997  ORF Transcript_39000/g.81997 Transcript_39000/m.81997 type:complete len:614 (-) Transcript_39000:559-2400(-)|eukprot:CAMPEP_0183736322 /NCGR_PEP_ID=MMETSP0737-20130205/49029_1 /TAXON_ID=385413 /ORGANISM="Thalassiosira miniscula, Strain CCMP1093" /LENGTH=613 /DNA_ID=CAMNT_0025970289 /DNA_START=219 /DNA_END=2060 /DNA_ORIENTATION=-